MFEIADRLADAAAAGRRLAVATAIRIDGSAPRTVGTSMAFDGESVIGTIAGGCVESSIVAVCEEVLADGEARTVEFGYSDEDAFSVGLTCGGTIRVHVQPYEEVRSQLEAGAVEVCEGFVERREEPARFVILGAMDFSAALARAASAVGYRVTVCDPRGLFATSARFPTAEVVVEWPTEYLAQTTIDERTAICVLSHDWRFDAESLAIALRSRAAYVGAMGSRSTDARRRASLAERGVDAARLHSPIGLDLGASTPEETAIAILAEVIAARTGRSTLPLNAVTGSLHA